jgi:transcriptional regulator with XRE-family HTH domain
MSLTGQLIKEARLKADISQREAAMLIGFTNVFLNRIEHGITPLPPRFINKVCEVIKIDRKRLFSAMKRDQNSKLSKKANE